MHHHTCARVAGEPGGFARKQSDICDINSPVVSISACIPMRPCAHQTVSHSVVGKMLFGCKITLQDKYPPDCLVSQSVGYSAANLNGLTSFCTKRNAYAKVQSSDLGESVTASPLHFSLAQSLWGCTWALCGRIIPQFDYDMANPSRDKAAYRLHIAGLFTCLLYHAVN